MPYLNLSTNRTVPLQKTSFTIGSDPSCDLPLTDKAVAPRHLILQSRGDGWQVATLNLHAPVTVNDRPISGLALLHDGDRIRMGEGVEFVWREADAPPQKGPWLGLLLIFLAVIAVLSILFAVYRFDAAYLEGVLPATMAPETTMQPAPAPASGAPMLQPAGVSPNGHPVYEMTLSGDGKSP